MGKCFKTKVRVLCSGSQPEASADPNLKAIDSCLVWERVPSRHSFTHGTNRSNGPFCCFRRLDFVQLPKILGSVISA